MYKLYIKKKIFTTFALLSLFFVCQFLASGNGEPKPLADDDFIISDKNNYICFDENDENFRTSEELVFHRPPSLSKAYSYNSYETFLVIDYGEIHIFEPGLKTSRGIGVGDYDTDVIKKYGLPDGQRENVFVAMEYQYICPDTKRNIKFSFDEDGKVTRIVLARHLV